MVRRRRYQRLVKLSDLCWRPRGQVGVGGRLALCVEVHPRSGVGAGVRARHLQEREKCLFSWGLAYEGKEGTARVLSVVTSSRCEDAGACTLDVFLLADVPCHEKVERLRVCHGP